jgi:hypothetical protein
MPDDRYSTEIWTFRNIGGFKTYLIPVRGKREPVCPRPSRCGRSYELWR